MTPEEFNTLFEETLTNIRSLISYKRDVYAPNENRFHNFDRVASTLGHHHISDSGISMDSLQACRGMWLKQLITLMDAIDGRDITWSIDRCDEVIHDLIIYLILTKGMFYRENSWHKKLKDTNTTSCEHNIVRCTLPIADVLTTTYTQTIYHQSDDGFLDVCSGPHHPTAIQAALQKDAAAPSKVVPVNETGQYAAPKEELDYGGPQG